MDRSQAWVVGWAIVNSFDELGKFSSWMGSRLKKAERHQEWAEENSVRLQLKISTETMRQLDLMATAWNQSPVKLAGLFVQYAMETFGPAMVMLKTQIGKNVRTWLRGPGDATKYDLDESAPAQDGEGQDNL